MVKQVRLTAEEWTKEGVKRYGEDKTKWVFKCPACGVHTSVQEWVDKGAKGMVAFSCIGRTLEEKAEFLYNTEKKQPCNYAGGGLFRINPIIITGEEDGEHQLFDFADSPFLEKE